MNTIEYGGFWTYALIHACWIVPLALPFITIWFLRGLY